MIDPTLLATGGIVAAAAGFWQQVKNCFGYVSSFVIVSATIEHPIAEPMGAYLKTKWTPLPSGEFFYVGMVLPFRDRNRSAIVPFKVRGVRSIYRRGWRFVIASGNSSLTLWSLRWAVDFDAMVSDALDLWEVRCQAQFDENAPNNSRFYIKKVIGREKGMFAADRDKIGHEGQHPTPIGDTAAGSSSQRAPVDTYTDPSFKYSRDRYIWSSAVDPFEGLYFSPQVMTYVEQAERWFHMGDWYLNRQLPWRRGWLLHGPGGTGKSSLAKAAAQKLKIPVYQFFLATLSDQEFIREWADMATPCVALFEDFDTVFNKRAPLTEHKSLTFECVLNQISGVSSMNGVFLIVTTNHIEAIDEAMGISCGRDGISTRPGRIDSVIEIGAISRENRIRMAQSILRDWPDTVPELVVAGDSATPIQFQEMCIQRAFELLAGRDELVKIAA